MGSRVVQRGQARTLQPLVSTPNDDLLSAQLTSCANEMRTSASPRASTRGSTSRRQIPSPSRAFVDAATLRCPRFPRWVQDGKEAVPGSSPGEGLKPPHNGGFCCLR